MTIESLLSKSALYAALARCFRRGGEFASFLPEAPAAWRDVLRGIVEKPALEYSRLLGGTGACPDGEISYRAMTPAGGILADIAGFYRAFGFPHAEGGDEKPDHISQELEFVAFLLAKEAHAMAMDRSEAAVVVRDARVGFLRDHLGRWVASLADALAAAAPGSFHAAAAGAAVLAVGEEVSVEPALAGASSEETPLQCQGCPEAPHE